MARDDDTTLSQAARAAQEAEHVGSEDVGDSDYLAGGGYREGFTIRGHDMNALRRKYRGEDQTTAGAE